MNKLLIIANWKSNPASVREAVLLAKKTEEVLLPFRNSEIIIAPPFPFLIPVREVLKGAKLGAQNTFWGDIGPATGEVSWRQLKTIRVSHIIIGHSERRALLGETDEMVNKKVRAALEHGFKVILCIGERERSSNEIPEIVGEELRSALTGVGKQFIKNVIVAYEPIWAISTTPGARPDTPDNAFRAAIYIRKVVATLYDRRIADALRVIYGGSVSARNSVAFIREGHMEGLLVGGASLDAKEFAKIIGEVKSIL